MKGAYMTRKFKNDNERGYILTINGRDIPISFEEGEELLHLLVEDCEKVTK